MLKKFKIVNKTISFRTFAIKEVKHQAILFWVSRKSIRICSYVTGSSSLLKKFQDMPVVKRGNDFSGEVFLKPSVTNIVCSRAKVIPVKSPSIAQSTSESGTSNLNNSFENCNFYLIKSTSCALHTLTQTCMIKLQRKLD